jgi:hypothetical protein
VASGKKAAARYASTTPRTNDVAAKKVFGEDGWISEAVAQTWLQNRLSFLVGPEQLSR